MTAWVTRLLGQALVWLVVLAITVPMFALALPVIAFGLIGRGLYELVRVLVGRGEVDGSSDGGEPDALTPGLRDQIDGRRTPAAEKRMWERLDADAQLDCGCLALAWPQATCEHCNYRSCVAHAAATHYCEPVDKPDPLDAWLEAAPRIKPANLDGPPETVPASAPAGDDFDAWELECDELKRWAKKLKGTR